MTKLTAVLVIIICLAACAMPVIADKEDDGVRAGITIAAATTTEDSSPDKMAEENKNDDRSDDLSPAVTTTTRETGGVERNDVQSGRDDSSSPPGQTISRVREENRREHEELNATLLNISAGQREQVKNQNEVRIAVHSLLAMENLTGGIGRNVSAIARDFNNSASAARALEDRIQNRNTIIRLFFGGDRDAAGELANLSAENRARIRELQQLMNSSSLDADVRTAMEEQVRILEKDQLRLEQLATREEQDRGLFGWIGR
jgi:hypothetical protein